MLSFPSGKAACSGHNSHESSIRRTNSRGSGYGQDGPKLSSENEEHAQLLKNGVPLKVLSRVCVSGPHLVLRVIILFHALDSHKHPLHVSTALNFFMISQTTQTGSYQFWSRRTKMNLFCTISHPHVSLQSILLTDKRKAQVCAAFLCVNGVSVCCMHV